MLARLKPHISARRLYILALSLAALAAVLLLPSLFRDETALLIRVSHQGNSLPDGFYVWQRLNAEGIAIKSITPDNDALVIRFETREQSIAAEKVLHQLLPYGFEIDQMKGSGSLQLMNRLSLHKQSVG